MAVNFVRKSISLDRFVYENIANYAKSRNMTFSCAVSTLCLQSLQDDKFSNLVNWTDEQKALVFDYIFLGERAPSPNEAFGYVCSPDTDDKDNPEK